jgi:putative membrane protein
MKRFAYLIMFVVSLLTPLLGFAQQTSPQQPQWDWPGPWHMWGGWAFWWVFPLFMLLMMVVCFAMFFGGHRRFRPWGPWQSNDSNRTSDDPTYSALRILNERYARGEIQREEYEEKKALVLSDARH